MHTDSSKDALVTIQEANFTSSSLVQEVKPQHSTDSENKVSGEASKAFRADSSKDLAVASQEKVLTSSSLKLPLSLGSLVEIIITPKNAMMFEAEAKPEVDKVSTSQKIIGAAVMAVIIGGAAFLYRRFKKDPEGPASDGLEHSKELVRGKWKFGLFECFGDFNICCVTCLCPAIRWADTIRMAGFMGFWSALTILLGLLILNEVTAGFVSIIILILLTYYRQQQRKMFEMQHGTCGSCVEDVLSYGCCACCSIVQEARHMEEAWAVQYPAVQVSMRQ